MANLPRGPSARFLKFCKVGTRLANLKEILVKTCWHSNARVFFLAFFLQEFALVPTLQNFRKRALGVPLANLT